MEEKQRLLKVTEVARHLGVTRQAVYRLIHSGEIPYLRLTAHRIRVRLTDLDEWVNSKFIKKGGGYEEVSFKDSQGEG